MPSSAQDTPVAPSVGREKLKCLQWPARPCPADPCRSPDLASSQSPHEAPVTHPGMCQARLGPFRLQRSSLRLICGPLVLPNSFSSGLLWPSYLKSHCLHALLSVLLLGLIITFSQHLTPLERLCNLTYVFSVWQPL